METYNTLPVLISIAADRAKPSNYSYMTTNVEAVADTEAKINIWSIGAFQQAGFNLSALCSVVHKFCAANLSPIRIIGACFPTISGKSLMCDPT